MTRTHSISLIGLCFHIQPSALDMNENWLLFPSILHHPDVSWLQAGSHRPRQRKLWKRHIYSGRNTPWLTPANECPVGLQNRGATASVMCLLLHVKRALIAFSGPSGLQQVYFHYPSNRFAAAPPSLCPLLQTLASFWNTGPPVPNTSVFSFSLFPSQMWPERLSCWRNYRSRVTSRVTSCSPWRKSYRASSARPLERWDLCYASPLPPL